MSSVSNYKEEHRRGELEFILLAVDALHECVRPPAASGETPPTFHQNYLGNSERVLAVREASSACSSGVLTPPTRRAGGPSPRRARDGPTETKTQKL